MGSCCEMAGMIGFCGSVLTLLQPILAETLAACETTLKNPSRYSLPISVAVNPSRHTENRPVCGSVNYGLILAAIGKYREMKMHTCPRPVAGWKRLWNSLYQRSILLCFNSVVLNWRVVFGFSGSRSLPSKHFLQYPPVEKCTNPTWICWNDLLGCFYCNVGILNA